jgi:hypothetical protein
MHFSFDHLQLLKSAEGKILTEVIYHNWQNKTKVGEFFEFLDRLELKFKDGYRLILTMEDSDEPGVTLDPDYDAERTNLLLLHEFHGKMGIHSEDMTRNALWAPLINRKLELVGLVKETGNKYRNDSVLFDLGEEKMEIRPGIEGLIAEPFEDV